MTNKRLNFVCGECGKTRMATYSGAVCPDGHGRIMPGITQRAIDLFEWRRWLEGQPAPTPVNKKASFPRLFKLNGVKYRLGGHVRKLQRESESEDVLFAMHRGEPRVFVREKGKE